MHTAADDSWPLQQYYRTAFSFSAASVFFPSCHRRSSNLKLQLQLTQIFTCKSLCCDATSDFALRIQVHNPNQRQKL
jgi:hypothetical protein